MEVIDFRMEKDFDWEFYQLHVSVRSFCSDLIFSGLNIVNDGLFNDRELEIIAFFVPKGSEAAPKFIEFDSVMTDINWDNGMNYRNRWIIWRAIKSQGPK